MKYLRSVIIFGSIVTRPVFHQTNCPCYDRFWAGPRIWTVPSVLAGSGILKSSDPVFGKVGAGSGFSLNSQIQNLSEIDFSFIVYIRIGNLSFDGEGGGWVDLIHPLFTCENNNKSKFFEFFAW